MPKRNVQRDRVLGQQWNFGKASQCLISHSEETLENFPEERPEDQASNFDFFTQNDCFQVETDYFLNKVKTLIWALHLIVRN